MSDNHNGRYDPIKARDAHYEEKSRFRAETQAAVREKEAELTALQAERQNLRMSAATTAGNIGLRYTAETNNYVRLVSLDEQDIVLPELVPTPDPLEPLGPAEPGRQLPERLQKPHKSLPRYILLWDILLWLFTVAIGVFVGIGLATIAGFNWRNDPYFLAMGIGLGLSVIGGLKVLISALWRLYGTHHARGDKSYGLLATSVGITLVGCLMDGYLGGFALQSYLRDRSFDGTDVQNIWLLVLLATAISAPTLIGSGVLYFKKGSHEVTDEEVESSRRKREIERAEAELERERQQRENERKGHHQARAAKLDADHQAELGQRQELYGALKSLEQERAADWEELKKNPEFKCLQGLIGQIDVLTMEIEDKKRDLTGYKISRGYERSAREKDFTGAPATNGVAKTDELAEPAEYSEKIEESDDPHFFRS